jgi:hypothetical protein
MQQHLNSRITSFLGLRKYDPIPRILPPPQNLPPQQLSSLPRARFPCCRVRPASPRRHPAPTRRLAIGRTPITEPPQSPLHPALSSTVPSKLTRTAEQWPCQLDSNRQRQATIWARVVRANSLPCCSTPLPAVATDPSPFTPLADGASSDRKSSALTCRWRRRRAR